MTPLTNTLRKQIQKHFEAVLPKLADSWLSAATLECGTISALTSIDETLVCSGSMGVSLVREDHLLESFHPSLPTLLEEHPTRKEFLLHTFSSEIIRLLSGLTAVEATNERKTLVTNRFQPLVCIELCLTNTVVCHVYLFTAFIEENWPLSTKQSGRLPKLGSVPELIKHSRLELYLSAGHVSMSIQQAMNLEVGQVFISSQPVQSPFSVKHEDERLFKSYLGRKAHKKAIVVR